MVNFYLILILFSLTQNLFGAASSSDSSTSSDNEVADELVVRIPSRSRTPVSGSGIRLIKDASGLRLDLMLLGKLTHEHLDMAQNHITKELSQSVISTPRTDRSKHILLEQISKEIDNQKKAILTEHPESAIEPIQTSRSSSESEDVTTHEELQKIAVSTHIANTLLTKMMVRMQDEHEQTQERLVDATLRANVEAVLAILGLLVAIAFGIEAVIA